MWPDINKIKIKQDPSDKIDVPGMTSEEGENKEEFTFSFYEGSPSVLTINLPKDENTMEEEDEYEEEESV